MEIKIILIDLKENLNKFDYPFLLTLSPKDIALLNKIENLLKKYFKRPWAYIGAEEPYEPKPELLNEIDKIDAKPEEKERLKELVTENKLPIELEVVLNGGDENEFHNHNFNIPSKLQLEQYLIPENKEIVFETLVEKTTHTLKIRGPSVLIVGSADHRREEGECFVIKFPSGEFKKK
jgi:hypothetical protein